MKIAIYTGSISNSPFIENLIIGLSNKHKILLFGTNKYNKRFNNKNISIITTPANRYLKVIIVLFSLFRNFVTKPKKIRSLIKQYLVETLILASLGGIIGTGVGVGAVTAVSFITPLPANVEIRFIMFAVSLSGSIGLIFGVLPAQRAAKLDPIVALRSL